MRARTLVALAGILSVAIATAPASAQVSCDPLPDWVVVFDGVADTMPSPRKVKALTIGNDETIRSLCAVLRDGDLTGFRTSVEAWSKRSMKRWHTKPGERVLVAAFGRADGGWIVGLKEEARKSRLSEDALMLARVAARIATAGVAGARADAIVLVHESYVLQKERANVTVWAAGATKAASAPAGDVSHLIRCSTADTPVQSCRGALHVVSVAPVTRDSIVASVVTGPAEHGFITANATYNTPRDLTLASDTSTVELAEAPTAFMIGLHYTFGDLSAGEEDRGFLESLLRGVFVGVSVQASRRPFSQVAVNAGLRHNPIPLLRDIWSFETLSPYVARQWVRTEVPGAEDGKVERRWSKPETVFGVAVNLAKAFEWLKGDEDEDE